jgi:hypothetical protein
MLSRLDIAVGVERPQHSLDDGSVGQLSPQPDG